MAGWSCHAKEEQCTRRQEGNHNPPFLLFFVYADCCNIWDWIVVKNVLRLVGLLNGEGMKKSWTAAQSIENLVGANNRYFTSENTVAQELPCYVVLHTSVCCPKM